MTPKEAKDGCLSVLLGLVLMAPMILFEGYVFKVMWGWFVAPLGLPKISVAHAYGLLLILTVARFEHKTAGRQTPKEVWNRVSMTVFVWLVLWGIGAIVVKFM